MSEEKYKYVLLDELECECIDSEIQSVGMDEAACWNCGLTHWEWVGDHWHLSGTIRCENCKDWCSNVEM